MKKIFGVLCFTIIMLMGIVTVSANSFNDSEYNKAVSLSEGTWSTSTFNSDLFFKVNFSQKNAVSVFEIEADGGMHTFHYYVLTRGQYFTNSSESATSLPAYASVPHLDDAEQGYIKIDYNSNASLHGKTLKVRLRVVPISTDGWQNAYKIGLNEEHTVQFSSMNDVRWYKFEVPTDSFRYSYTINTSGQGSYIAAIYNEAELKASGDPTFCSCIRITPSRITVNTRMGNGTYYIQLYPSPFSNDILNTKFKFATDDKANEDVTTTSFGATVSTWAKPEVERAYQNGVIPAKMAQDDLTKKVTRAEFAAIAVEVFEALSRKSVAASTDCTFGDISSSDYQTEIKKAYGIKAIEGYSATQFGPNDYITREQLATILCRVLKKDMEDKFIPFSYVSNYTPFADDFMISDWAKPSVYFMSHHGLVNGMQGNVFAPKNTNNEEEALGYANATKEQAILIGNRMFENFGS